MRSGAGAEDDADGFGCSPKSRVRIAKRYVLVS